MVIFTAIHTVAHWNNFAQLAAKNKLGFKGFLQANFTTGPGWTGYVMLLVLGLIVWTAMEKPRRANYERFWNVHHLFIVFFVFWSVHGVFCMIKPDTQSFCTGGGVFWQFWIYGAVVYLVERIMREVRGRQPTVISKVVQHPSNVVEIQIKKDNIKTRAGQVRSPWWWWWSRRRRVGCGSLTCRSSTSSCAARRYPCGSIIPSR